MIKVIETKDMVKKIVRMGDMKPLQVGKIVDTEAGCYMGHVVMRTASFTSFEVMSLSDPREDVCWTHQDCPVKVELLPEGEKVIISVFNKNEEDEEEED